MNPERAYSLTPENLLRAYEEARTEREYEMLRAEILRRLDREQDAWIRDQIGDDGERACQEAAGQGVLL